MSDEQMGEKSGVNAGDGNAGDGNAGENKGFSVKMDGYDFYAIEPITTCPHITKPNIQQLKQFLEVAYQAYETTNDGDIFNNFPCGECKHTSENWVCLVCTAIGCSRYRDAHMVSHYDKSNHSVCLSFSDGSFNCYECDSYITNQDLDQCRLLFGWIKHRLIPKGIKLDWTKDLSTQVAEFKSMNE
jgi:hypothetical protein